jgi:hypothetical protein
MSPSANPSPDDNFEPDIASDANARLYVAALDDIKAVVKSDWSKEYCFDKSPGEDHFHLIVGGEIYIQHGHEKLCLECALGKGLVTRNRLNWQR